MRALAVVGVTSVLALGACSGDAPGLRLVPFGVTIDGNGGGPPPYFTIPLCAEDGDHEVTIRDVGAQDEFGSGVSFDYFVDWPGGEDAEPSFGGRDLLPTAFEPAAGTTGTVPECGATEAADIAVVFPEVGDEPVGIDRLEVTYESEGGTATVVGEPTFVQCGINQTGTDGSCQDRQGG